MEFGPRGTIKCLTKVSSNVIVRTLQQYSGTVNIETNQYKKGKLLYILKVTKEKKTIEKLGLQLGYGSEKEQIN